MASMTDFDPELLRRARVLSGLSLRELASRAGVHVTSLTRFENGLTPSRRRDLQDEEAIQEACFDRFNWRQAHRDT